MNLEVEVVKLAREFRDRKTPPVIFDRRAVRRHLAKYRDSIFVTTDLIRRVFRERSV